MLPDLIGLDDRNHFPGVLRLRSNRISPVVSKTHDLQKKLKNRETPLSLRIAAADALAMAAASAGRDTLQDVINDDDECPELRNAARLALSRFKDEATVTHSEDEKGSGG